MASSSTRECPIILYFAGKKKNQALISPKVTLSQRTVASPLTGSLNKAVLHSYLELSLFAGLATQSEILKPLGQVGGSVLERKREFGGERIKIDAVHFFFLRAPYRFKVLLLI